VSNLGIGQRVPTGVPTLRDDLEPGEVVRPAYVMVLPSICREVAMDQRQARASTFRCQHDFDDRRAGRYGMLGPLPASREHDLRGPDGLQTLGR
jgi:hypothetical protein